MTPTELKAEFVSMTLPATFELSASENILDVNGFLKTSFDIVESWTRSLDSCPAWERLLRFHQAIKS